MITILKLEEKDAPLELLRWFDSRYDYDGKKSGIDTFSVLEDIANNEKGFYSSLTPDSEWFDWIEQEFYPYMQNDIPGFEGTKEKLKNLGENNG